MDLVGDCAPGVDLVFAPNAWPITEPTGRSSGCDCTFGDYQGSWYRCSLAVIFLHHGGWSAVLGGTEAGERSHGDAVLELHVAYLKRLEEVGLRHDW